MKKAKLVFVIYSLHKGGAERVLSTLSNSFSARHYQVTIICMDSAEPGYPIAADINVISLLKRDANQPLFKRLKYGMMTYLRLLKCLHRIKPLCVISFMTSANLWTGLCCGILGIPYIVSERTTPEHTVNRFGYLLKYLSCRVYGNSKAIVVPAKGIETCLKKNTSFRKLGNYSVIKNPVFTFKAPSEKRIHPRKFILAVGRLSYVKGFDILINAFGMLNEKNIDLLILGQGPEFQCLRKLIDDLGLQNRVFLMGAKDELQDYYAQAALFILSSRNEGYPNALIEAMSAGCACVATDCEFGPSEIIDHRINGLLIPVERQDLLSQAMAELLSSEELRAQLARNAKSINQTNSLQVIADQWEELILSK